MSPRSPEQFAEIRDRSHERLMESALTLFARNGYANTSIRMIAREAGVSQGLLYNYFRSKEELLNAIFARSMADVQRSFERARSEATPHRQLENLVRASVQIVEEEQRFWRLSYGLRFQPDVVEGLRAATTEWTAAIRAELERLLRAVGSDRADVEAHILFALIDGIAQHYLLDPAGYPLEEVISAVLERFDRTPA